MDPKSIMSLALGGVAGLAAGAGTESGPGGGGAAPAPAPTGPKEQQQPGKKPRPQSSQPSFIGSAAVPGSANTGGKTLIGSM